MTPYPACPIKWLVVCGVLASIIKHLIDCGIASRCALIAHWEPNLYKRLPLLSFYLRATQDSDSYQ